jgi:CHY zinc finger
MPQLVAAAAPPPRVSRRRSSLASSMVSAHEGPPMSRRRSSLASTTSAVGSVVGNGHMSEEEQEERRRQIKNIMRDASLSQKEKSKNIQALMDGRQNRRSSDTTRASLCSNASSAYISGMAHAAALATEYYSDETMNDGNGDSVVGETASHSYNHYYNSRDERSVASSVTTNEQDDAQSSEQRRPAPPKAMGSYRQFHGRSFSLQDWKDSDRVTAAANTTVLNHNPVQVSRLMEQSRPPCEHYDRNCTVVSPCCGLAFGCRICHDDCPVLPPPLASRRIAASPANHKNKLNRRRSMPVDLGGEEDEHHLIDRFAIKEVICRECYTRQTSKT